MKDSELLSGIPKFLQDNRIPCLEWVKYKGEVCVADLNYDKSVKAHRPIINIHYCMTKAMNGIIEKTVNWNPDLFKTHEFRTPHKLEYSIWSSKISWCPTCHSHFYDDETHFMSLQNKTA